MSRVRVELGDDSYDVVVGSGILTRLGEAMVKLFAPGAKALIITNPTVNSLYGKTVYNSLAAAGFNVFVVEVPDGEQYKSLEEATRLYDVAFDHNLDRTSVIVALGGGVIGDLAGFIAATYMRGVKFVQVPTTLLAQVDSSVGGKVAVNHPQGKNIIGSFYQPDLVWADVETLKTLPPREVKAGLAEVIKYGVIWDEILFTYLENNIDELLGLQADQLIHIVSTSCAIKAKVVEQDEKEIGVRAILNLGHTFGHALEALTNYRTYKHGEGVAIGMVLAGQVAVAKQWYSEAEQSRLVQLIENFGLPTTYSGLPREQVLAKMYQDKKLENGALKLVIPQKIGQVKITKEVSDAEVLAILPPA